MFLPAEHYVCYFYHNIITIGFFYVFTGLCYSLHVSLVLTIIWNSKAGRESWLAFEIKIVQNKSRNPDNFHEK